MAPSSSSPFARSNRPSTTPSTRFSSSKPVKRNASILQFFSKAETPPKPVSTQQRITQFVAQRDDSSVPSLSSKDLRNNGTAEYESLFVEDVKAGNNNGFGSEGQPLSERERSRSPDDLWARLGSSDIGAYQAGGDRYHEDGMAVKRRKMGFDYAEVNIHGQSETAVAQEMKIGQETRIASNNGERKFTGPFLIDSDSEDDPPVVGQLSSQCNTGSALVGVGKSLAESGDMLRISPERGLMTPNEPGERLDGGECPAMDPGGSDCEETSDYVDLTENNHFEAMDGCPNDEEVPICPICQKGLQGLTDDAASLHVNKCLDGESIPEVTKVDASESVRTRADLKVMARPGQKNPFAISSTVTKSSSAFSKLMSGNAEDAAWAAAAANEVASRGKQAFERTCPFYKILPGFSICVDAFRYGAVEGCSAYFLSHFHSDHYVGLNSNWSHGPIYCSKVTGNLVRQQLNVNPKFVVDLDFEKPTDVPDTDGVKVTMIHANHCPGSALFLFEKKFGQGKGQRVQRILHCGDFRASPAHIQHPLLRPDPIDQATGQPKQQRIDVCYLDTTYLNPKYAFPSQQDVIDACAQMCVNLNENKSGCRDLWQRGKSMPKDSKEPHVNGKPTETSKSRLLVVIGTYSIGKERICLGIAKALGCKIFATAAKQRICACLEDPELSSLLTSDPLEAQVHMHSLMEIRSDTLSEYLASFKPHFTHVVGFRPTGWNYRPPTGRMVDNPAVSTVLQSESWKTRFTVKDLVPQRGSNKDSSCFGVPYSEHSSFRELTMFCCALRIAKVIPTVNVASRKTREKMKAWIDKWEAEKRKSGLFKLEEGATRW
ncbi:conserved hypothetical protein [Uncinocarpus reesii 1704]|uniref:DNA repair metallo-beta-lactamase domain-containing protein n=1 Tax=Uncinocarpus reesii (strain UAMH 1704) TaxID=336963 RepID=C4JHG7_UNCRE|nr:uncharacterized protein UREG_01330 [Uncinocarpus reesii 1704]EEP76481.1 conserved hypothetical protein [Uncinocarpus reesii 1704]